METIKLSFPSKPQYVQMLRLMTASIASTQGFDIEVIEDLRVCISEAVNDLIPENETIDVTFGVDDAALTMEIRYEHELGESEDENTGERSQMRRLILESLMDEVEETEHSVKLTKKRN